MLIKLQSEAYIQNFKIKSQDFKSLNIDSRIVPEFEIDNKVLFLNQPDGYCPQKLSTIWQGLFIIIKKNW